MHTKNTEYQGSVQITRRKISRIRDVKMQVSLQKECRKTKSAQNNSVVCLMQSLFTNACYTKNVANANEPR